MTAIDDLKSAFAAYLDANATRLDSMEAQIAALTPVVQPPPVEPPPDETPPDDSQNPPASDPPAQEDPPPVIADPNLVFTIVQPSDPMPAADGTNAKVFTVPDKYRTIKWQWIHGAKPGMQDIVRLADPDADHVTFQENHSSGQKVTFHKDATLLLWGGEKYPDEIASAPATGSTTPPPATQPPARTTVPPPPASKDAAAPVDPSRLALRITIPGSDPIVFNGSDGVDKKNWTKPSHTQRNIMVQNTTGDRVFFRPDTTSGRMEIVYERGEAFTFPATHLDAYAAEILLDGNVIDTLNIPAHYWLSRWRWQSSWRPFVRTPDDLKAAKIFPPNYRRVTKFRQKLPDIAPAYDYMGTSSIVKYMPTTGERNDIGIVPEITGAYLCTGDPGAAYSMRQWAESASSFPVHIRDFKTGKPINWGDYPKANTYYDQRYSTPQVAISPKSPLTWDNAHEPSLSFVMYMLTDDLYYLEELQFFANRSLHASPAYQGMQFGFAQTRGFCWTLRDFFDVVLATPDDVPDTLLPRSYFKAYLDYNRDFVINNYVNNPDPKTAVFNSGVDPLRMPFWQEDYFASVVGLAVYRGFSDWAPVFQWKYKSNIYRTDPAQWPSGCPSSYYPQPAGVIARSTVGNSPLEATVNFKAMDGVWTATWVTDHWNIKNPSDQTDGNVTLRLPAGANAGDVAFADGDSVTITVTQPKTPMELAAMNGIVAQPEGTMLTNLLEYVQECRYALAMAEILGDTSVTPNLDRLETQMVNSLMPKANFNLYWRWTLDRPA